MRITVNGSDRSVSEGTTVESLVASMGAPANGRGVAVAVGGEVVPRSEWQATELVSGIRVEVLIAVQGG